MKQILILALLMVVVTSCVTHKIQNPITFNRKSITVNLSFYKADLTNEQFQEFFPDEKVIQIIKTEPSGLCFTSPYVSNDPEILSNDGRCYYFEPIGRWLNYKETVELIKAFQLYAFMQNII